MRPGQAEEADRIIQHAQQAHRLKRTDGGMAAQAQQIDGDEGDADGGHCDQPVARQPAAPGRPEQHRPDDEPAGDAEGSRHARQQRQHPAQIGMAPALPRPVQQHEGEDREGGGMNILAERRHGAVDDDIARRQQQKDDENQRYPQPRRQGRRHDLARDDDDHAAQAEQAEDDEGHRIAAEPIDIGEEQQAGEDQTVLVMGDPEIAPPIPAQPEIRVMLDEAQQVIDRHPDDGGAEVVTEEHEIADGDQPQHGEEQPIPPVEDG